MTSVPQSANESAMDPGAAAKDALAYVDAINRVQAVIEFDLEGQVLTANQVFLDTFGYELEQIKGRHHRQFCSESLTESDDYRVFWVNLRNGRFDTGVYERVDASGNTKYLRASYNPVFDEQGKPVKVVKFATDVTETMQEQAASKARLAALDRSQAVIQFDLSGVIVNANQNFLDALGYSLNEIQGQHHRIFCDQAFVNSSDYQELWAALARGEVRSGEFMRLTKSGNEIWINASYNPLFDAGGNPIGVVKFATDITESKIRNAETQAVMAAVRRAQAVIEFNLDGTIIGANDNFLNTLGYELSEIVGQHHSMFCERSFVDSPAYAGLWRSLAAGEFESGEYMRLDKDGREVWINASYNPIIDPNGKVVKVIKFASDITAQKLESADHEGKIAAINAAQALIEFDLNGQVLTANENFLSAFGYREEEIVGQHHRQFCLPEYAESPEYQTFWQQLGAGEAFSGQFERVGKNGKQVWIQGNYNPVHDPKGKVIKVVKIATDVTRQVTEEAALQSKIESISGNLAKMSTEISEETAKVSTNAQNLGATTEEMSGCVEELSASIDSIAQNSKLADEQAKTTRSDAEEGGKAIAQSIEAMDLINRSSEEIKDILAVIGEIASQTNLLAFNAAIEAARAGEHGLGFSVVADEVRKLAERSSQATQDISKLIGESTKRIERGSEISREAGEAFKSIVEGVVKTSQSITQITSATVEQQAASSDVAGAIEQAANTAEASAAATQVIAKSTKDLAEEANSLIESIKQSA
ncbi:MAG: PAS domain S-box protein [Pseudomonadales bacterium]